MSTDIDEFCPVDGLMPSRQEGRERSQLTDGYLKCKQCLIRQLCFMGDHYNECLTELDEIIVHKRPLRKGKHLYWQDTPFKSLFVVQSGALKSYRLSAEGRERVLGFYLPGDLVGTDGLFNNRYSSSMMALDTTSVCELPFQLLLALFEHREALLRHFLSIISGELLEEQQHTLLSQNSTEERVAAFLFGLSLRQQKRQLSRQRIPLPMARKDIANYLGIAVETVSRVFSRFQERGWLDVNGRDIVISDWPAIECLVQNSQS